MADVDYTNVLSQLGAGALGLTANQQMAQQMATAYNQAGNYIQAAQQQATGYQAPYLTAGASALPGLQTAVGNVGNQLSMADYQAGPYAQVAASAQKTAADQLKAQAATTGMYGSGNMANQLQQNALNTQLQYYDTANQRQLANQQAKASAYYNLANMGATAGQSMGSNTMDAAKYMAAIAQGQGVSQTKTTAQQAALISSMLSGASGALGSLAKSAWSKMQSGQGEAVSDEELKAFETAVSDLGIDAATMNALEQDISTLGGDYNYQWLDTGTGTNYLDTTGTGLESYTDSGSSIGTGDWDLY